MSLIFFYNRDKRSGAIGTIAPNAFKTTAELPAGSFSDWTHVVASGQTLLFYNQGSGAAAFGTLTAGSVKTDLEFKPGSFGTWTSIVPTAAGWLFYDRYTGAAAIGQYISAGIINEFVTITSLPPESSSEWTHIVANGNAVLFYNQLNASAAVGTISAAGITTTRLYPPGTFGVWTHIVNDGPTVFFYNRDNRGAAIGTLTAAGLTTDSTLPSGSFSAWTHISANGPTLLFYNHETGAGAIGTVSASGFSTVKSFGQGSFGGWSNITGDSACGPERQQVRMAVLLCQWRRPPGVATVLSSDFYQQYMFDMSAPAGVGRYWFDQTAGQVRFTGAVHDWIPLTKDPNDPSIANNRQALAAQAISDAQASGCARGTNKRLSLSSPRLGQRESTPARAAARFQLRGWTGGLPCCMAIPPTGLPQALATCSDRIIDLTLIAMK